MIKKTKMYGNQENYSKMFKMVKPEIPLALDGEMNGVRGNCYRLLEKR